MEYFGHIELHVSVYVYSDCCVLTAITLVLLVQFK